MKRFSNIVEKFKSNLFLNTTAFANIFLYIIFIPYLYFIQYKVHISEPPSDRGIILFYFIIFAAFCSCIISGFFLFIHFISKFVFKKQFIIKNKLLLKNKLYYIFLITGILLLISSVFIFIPQFQNLLYSYLVYCYNFILIGTISA